MSSPFIAQISIVGFNFPPRGWALCNGQTLSISQNAALFSLLGITFGGNGTTNFALPNFQGRTPKHVGTGYPLGSNGGATTVTLSANEMPSHTHSVVGSSTLADSGDPTGAFWGTAPGNPYASSSTTTMKAGSVGNAGSSQPHSNLQPYQVLNFVIALQGIYPSRS